MEQENMVFSEDEAIVEAVLFTMGKSVDVRQLAAALGRDVESAKDAAARLKERYEREQRGMQIIELEDSFQMCTRAKYYENLIQVASAPKKQVLTDVVLETLSIIAYKQPITKLEIEKIRGVKSDHAVNRLIEYNLVYEVGRLDAPGRPALFPGRRMELWRLRPPVKIWIKRMSAPAGMPGRPPILFLLDWGRWE